VAFAAAATMQKRVADARARPSARRCRLHGAAQLCLPLRRRQVRRPALHPRTIAGRAACAGHGGTRWTRMAPSAPSTPRKPACSRPTCTSTAPASARR
jgi:hypothetical protein